MDALISTQNSKTIEYEGKLYNCKFQIIREESIDVSIFLLNSLKFKGNITLEKIKIQIFYFSDINEIYEEIIQSDFGNFSIIKENDKYKLKIKITILQKGYYLLIDLVENKDINLINNDIINYYENIIKEKDNTISELREIIKFKNEKIKSLKEQLKNILNKKFEEIQINLDSFKNELKIKNEKEEEEKKKREEERKQKEKREIERKQKEKEDDDDFCLSVFKEIKDNIKKTTEEIFGEDVFQEPLTIKKELIKNNKDKDNNRNHNKKLFLPRHAIIKKFRSNLYYSLFI